MQYATLIYSGRFNARYSPLTPIYTIPQFEPVAVGYGSAVEEDIVSAPSLYEKLFYLLDRLIGRRIRLEKVDIIYESDSPLVVIRVGAKASEALGLWERIAPLAKTLLGVDVVVVWSGENDLPPRELGRRLGEILAELGLHPSTIQKFDAAKLLE